MKKKKKTTYENDLNFSDEIGISLKIWKRREIKLKYRKVEIAQRTYWMTARWLISFNIVGR
jgi:hypothetical protein